MDRRCVEIDLLFNPATVYTFSEKKTCFFVQVVSSTTKGDSFGWWSSGKLSDFEIQPFFFKSHVFGQIIATSHDLTPNGGLVRDIPLFQGNLGWWNIIPFGQMYDIGILALQPASWFPQCFAELSNESTTATPLPSEDQAVFDLDRRFL